jgi:NTP pyrophosphatase (non-canonical NTP hydrolase)
MADATDPLRHLAQATLGFYARFGLKPVVADALMVFHEEVREFTEAAQDGTSPQHTAEEAADVIVTIIGTLHAAGIGVEELVAQMAAVAAKNDAKTHDTHVYADGKIRRRPPRD